MRETRITCNKCGKILEGNEYNYLSIDPLKRPGDQRLYENGCLNVDLCPECTRKMLEFLNENPNYFEKTR